MLLAAGRAAAVAVAVASGISARTRACVGETRLSLALLCIYTYVLYVDWAGRVKNSPRCPASSTRAYHVSTHFRDAVLVLSDVHCRYIA